MKQLFFSVAILLLCSLASAEEFPSVQVYEQTSKSVVLIHSKFEGKQSLVGAGSLIANEGAILTCAHVVVDREGGKPAVNVQVFIKPERITGDIHRDGMKRFPADIVAYDSSLDLAVLRVRDFRDEIEPIQFARSDEVRIGEEVVAIGHPEQGGFWSVTYGHISGEIESQAGIHGKDVYQTDTNVNRGNSGGPLLDRRGRLVGVTANIARVGAGNLPITGVNFAIKSGVAEKWLKRSGYSSPYGIPPGAIGTGSAQGKPKDEANIPVPTQPSGAQVGGQKEDRFLTPRRPYRMEEFLAEIEKDMSDMMEEMRGKIRR